jgi:cyclomaltodextrinase / maltogenic alpha-amylase / neopullulanase
MISFRFPLVILLTVLLNYACTPGSEAPTVLVHPSWSYSQTIYEVNVRQFSEEGTFRAVQDRLPELKELGVGILWLMPIHPIGEVNRKGSLGSYYSVKDYFDVNPEFGTKDDFRAFVQAAHGLGMYVIIDWVANHTAWDNPIAASHPDFFETDADGNFIPPRGTDWDDVIQLNFNNPAVHDYMISALRYWVEEFDIDGYRCDVADLVPTPFWDRARKELDTIKPVFMLAEAENPEHHVRAFDMSYAWNMHHMFNSVAQGNKPVAAIDELRMNDQKIFPAEAFRMNFTSNHDENSWNGTVFERLGDGVRAFAVLSTLMEGMPLVYNGQEAGMQKRLEFFEKDPIDWSDPMDFRSFYSRLLNLRRSNQALYLGDQGGAMQHIHSDHPESIYAFSRSKMDSSVIVILNLSAQSITTRIESQTIAGTYTNLFTDETVVLTGIQEMVLQPWDYVVYYR